MLIESEIMPCHNNGWLLFKSFCSAPSVEDVVALLVIVVLGCINFIAWSACVG